MCLLLCAILCQQSNGLTRFLFVSTFVCVCIRAWWHACVCVCICTQAVQRVPRRCGWQPCDRVNSNSVHDARAMRAIGLIPGQPIWTTHFGKREGDRRTALVHFCCVGACVHLCVSAAFAGHPTVGVWGSILVARTLFPEIKFSYTFPRGAETGHGM